MKNSLLFVLILLGFFFTQSCQKAKIPKENISSKGTHSIEYAKGFTLEEFENFSILRVNTPWPDAKETFTYILSRDPEHVPDSLRKEIFVKIPVQKIVLTSTTYIPSVVALQEIETIKGFSGLDYISSQAVRAAIDQGQIKELQANDQLNVEMTIDLQPSLVIGHGMDAHNPALKSIEQAGIPVLYNGDWVETSPLGKAEWIKFFGALYDKNEQAREYFEDVKAKYEHAKSLVKEVKVLPTVMSGSMYQDVWYAPQGESWMAQFIKDAKGDYIWSENKGTGSVSMSFETAFEEGMHAEYWIGPGQFYSYQELLKSNSHYKNFKAFQDQKVFTYSAKKGAKGGVLFYEEAPNRPDLVLKDMIFILHPSKLPNYQPTFIETLQP